MKRANTIASVGSVLTSLLLGAMTLKAQAPAASAAPFTGEIAMCEDSDGCSEWSLKDGHGVGRWTSGGIAALTVEKLDADSVTIRRVDSEGTGKGITAVYTGARTGNSIEGNVAASWPGHGPDSTTKWHAIVSPQQFAKDPASAYSRSLPAGWGECEDLGNACAAEVPPTRYVWGLAAQKERAQNMDGSGGDIRLIIDSYGPGPMVIRRFDFTGKFAGMTGLYTGVRVGSKAKGTAVWIWPGHLKEPLRGNWSASILPRNCGAAGTTTADAGSEAAIAIAAFMIGDAQAGFKCNLASAKRGDAEAQMNVAINYLKGDGTTKDPRQAVYWTAKAVAQGNVMAARNLSTMYRFGQGVPVDTLRAELFEEEATLSQWASEDERRPPADTFLDLIGNYIADTTNLVFLVKRGGAGQALARRVEHRSAVVDHMGQGMSRVEAEDKVAVEEGAKLDGDYKSCLEKNGANAGDTTINSSTSYPTHRSASQNRAQATDKCSLVSSGAEADGLLRRQYLGCVHRFVDSEAIEKSCHL